MLLKEKTERGCYDKSNKLLLCDFESVDHVISCCGEELCNHKINITLPSTVQ